ncbi:UNVERIFIED_ORG: hypothetical protein ABIC97_003255 [Peribacillus simplex]
MKCHSLNAIGMIVVAPFISKKLPLEEILKDFWINEDPGCTFKDIISPK